MTFFKALGVMILFWLLVGGVVYWIWFAIRKFAPDLKYKIKYKIFKRRYDEGDVELLIECFENDLSNDDVCKFFLTSGLRNKKVRELVYIYKEMKKLKGGGKHERFRQDDGQVEKVKKERWWRRKNSKGR